MQMGDSEGARRLLEEFDQACAEFAPRAAEELKRRRGEKPDPESAGRDKAAERREAFERRKLAEKASGFVTERMLLHCRLALGQRRAPQRRQEALALLEKLAKARRQPLGLRIFLAQGFAALKEYGRALEQLARVRRADRDSVDALSLEARIHFCQKHYDDAVNSAVEALSLIYFQPELHYLLGVSLARLGDRPRAEQAFRTALGQAPEFPAAQEALGRLISRDRERVGEGALHMARAAASRKHAKERAAERKAAAEATASAEPAPAAGLTAFDHSQVAPPADRSRVITVVAGLPRSGTSMMMQMIAAAGLEPYTDEQRLPDADNPRGYLEHERATRLHRDASWVPEARRKVVKIVAHLLPFLPAGEQYRIIFMHRDLREVMASQRAMLERLGRKGGKLAEARMMSTFTQQLVAVQTWLQRQPRIAVLPVDYAAALADPAATAERLARFLGPPFDARAAAAAIEPALRRQKAPQPS